MKLDSSGDPSDLQEALIELLRSNPEDYFSIQTIADKIGCDDRIAMEAIGQLSRWGYRFETDSHSHFRFSSAPDAIFPIEIRYNLKTGYIGQNIVARASVTSTNDIARELAEQGAPEGTVVIAEKQVKGRGRMGRSWHSPAKKGLWLTLILRPEVPSAQAPSLSILMALSLSEILHSSYKLESGIKWPNDCQIDGRKVTGILTELSAELDRVDYVLVGMGINVNLARSDFPPELHKIATSIRMEYGEEIDRIGFLRMLLERIEKNYEIFKKKGLKPFLPKIKKHSVLLGKRIKLLKGRKLIQAVAHDFDADGALIAKRKGELLRVTAGEVSVIKADRD